MRRAAATRGGLTGVSAGYWAQDDSPACQQNLLSQLPVVGLSAARCSHSFGSLCCYNVEKTAHA